MILRAPDNNANCSRLGLASIQIFNVRLGLNKSCIGVNQPDSKLRCLSLFPNCNYESLKRFLMVILNLKKYIDRKQNATVDCKL